MSSVEIRMAEDVGRDQFALIRIEGMHCHRCEQAIQRTLGAFPGVREVEVDFASGQASVLFDGLQVDVASLMRAVDDAGYHAAGVTQGEANRPPVGG